MQRVPALCLFLAIAFALDATAAIRYDKSIPQLGFAADAVNSALQGRQATVVFDLLPDTSRPEAFSISVDGHHTFRVVGSDPAGAMYGGLELAEMIRIGGLDGVRPVTQSPYMGMRGIKFNIPLDVRTPSYSDLGDAGQHNIQHVWDFAFWKSFIDEAASHRYNYISLWNLHPFPSLVKLPQYPDIALDDVKRAVDLERKFYDNGRGQNQDIPEIMDDLETVHRMSIEDKIEFWKKVMRYGKSRNIDFYFVTWNVFDYGIDGKYGITDDLDNPATVDYFRNSVSRLFLTYPDLKGIGITTGENMHDASNQEKEDWMLETYGKGVLDVVRQQPGREITFLHRQHQAGAGAIAETFRPLIDHPGVDFIFSYKYAKAHAYSSTRQPFYKSFAEEIAGHDRDLKTIWTMRNDSTYLFRWAAPDFLREFVRNVPIELTRGYYFGSDGWIWGREFIRNDFDGPRDIEIRKHWFQWMLWGRFAYDPHIPNERFIRILQARFPRVNCARLLEAWQSASMVYPLVTGFHWGVLDYLWYPEACIGFPRAAGTETGFNDVNSFITKKVHPGSGYTSIPDYVEQIRNGQSFTGTGPLDVSAELLQNADIAFALLRSFDAGENDELRETLADIEAMAYLSRYYGHKIAGSTWLHSYRVMGDNTLQAKAVSALEKAAVAWEAYTANILQRYQNPLWLVRIRTGVVDFSQITHWVHHDIDIARQATSGPKGLMSSF